MPTTDLPITIRHLPAAELHRIAELDRTEVVTVGYRMVDGKLVSEAVDWHVPPWSPEDTGKGHCVPDYVRGVGEHLAAGGVAIAAEAGERLAGLAVYRPGLAEDMAQLAGLWVSQPYRRRGIARRLVAEVEALARASGARRLYVSATPSGSAIGFYLSQGFRPTPTPDPVLLAKEPEDIHMVKPLEV